jgi:hypothetical protein
VRRLSTRISENQKPCDPRNQQEVTPMNPSARQERKHSKSRTSWKRSLMVDRAHSVLLWRQAQVLLSVDDLAKAAALQRRRVETIVEFGLIEPATSSRSGPLFKRSSVERLRRIVRLRRDLGINLAGIAAVLDMRERIESLQREVQLLRGQLQGVD